MFADGWGGSSKESAPEPTTPGGGVTPDLLDSCRESTRRAERLIEQLAPVRDQVEPTDRYDELGWAIRALEEAQAHESDH